MPNIMITSRCNLTCKYCFASELVNQFSASDITLENFQIGLNFLTTCHNTRIGLIGGEPTLHKDFQTILSLLEQHKNITSVILYTNGIELEKYLEILSNPKFEITFNCNSIPNITEQQQWKLIKNIDTYFSNSNNLGLLGINIYDDVSNYEYVFQLAKKYHHPIIKVALTVPPLSTCLNNNGFNYFLSRKSQLLPIIQLANKYNIKLNFDCDFPPFCEMCLDNNLSKYIISSSKLCSPVIDITQNLEAIRCFGTSHLCKVKINDFKDLDELRNYFIKTIDLPAKEIASNARCINCLKRQNCECFGGCIRFKTKELLNGDY